MIEFEMKYKLKEKPKELNSFAIANIINQCDVYYDTNDFKLIKDGNFLRIRNNEKIDFKIDIDDNMHLYCKETSFKISEINKNILLINQILENIGLPISENVTGIENFLLKNNFNELAKIDKIRTIYNFNKNCTIYIDEVKNLGLFLEAEIIIENDTINRSDVDKFKNKIIKTLKDANIIYNTSEIINTGYVELYLLTHNPEAYELGKFKI